MNFSSILAAHKFCNLVLVLFPACDWFLIRFLVSVHSSRRGEYGGDLDFDKTVMSPAFYCFVDSDVAINLPIEVISQVLRESSWCLY
jgi:hypothetical protein